MTEIVNIQEKYIQILEDYFGEFYRGMKNDGLTFDKLKRGDYTFKPEIKRYAKIMDEVLINSYFFTFYQDIAEFWIKYRNRIVNILNRQSGIKAIYPGTYFDSHSIKGTALYADTTIYEDPFLARFKVAADTYAPISFSCNLLGNIFKMLSLKNLIISDIDYPVVVILPAERDMLDIADDLLSKNTDKTFCMKSQLYTLLTLQDTLNELSEIFEKEFVSIEEFENFIKSHQNFKDVIQDIKNGNLLSDPINNLNAEDQLILRMNYTRYLNPDKYKDFNNLEMIKEALFSSTAGFLNEINSGLFTSIGVNAEYCTNARTKWNHFIWKIKNDSKQISNSLKLKISENLLVLNALQMDEFKWLGNIPINSIVKLRQNGELQDIRELLQKEVEEVKNCKYEDLHDVTSQVNYNLKNAFRKHQSEVANLDREYKKRYKIDVSTLVVGGCLAVAGTVFPPISIIGRIVGGSSIIDILSSLKNKEKQIQEMKNRPIGLLLEARETK